MTTPIIHPHLLLTTMPDQRPRTLSRWLDRHGDHLALSALGLLCFLLATMSGLGVLVELGVIQ